MVITKEVVAAAYDLQHSFFSNIQNCASPLVVHVVELINNVKSTTKVFNCKTNEISSCKLCYKNSELYCKQIAKVTNSFQKPMITYIYYASE